MSAHAPVDSPGMPKPLGPYSQVVRAGDFLFVAGQAGIHPVTGQTIEGGFEAEARQAYENLRTVLLAAGSGLEHVVKTTTFGAFISLMPGKDGLLHISKLRSLAGGKRVDNVDDVVKIGQKVLVEISEIDQRGKLSLSPVEESEAGAEPAAVDA